MLRNYLKSAIRNFSRQKLIVVPGIGRLDLPHPKVKKVAIPHPF